VTEAARTEPIAGRIIEVPEDEVQSEVLRNPRSGFIAYVPVGSVKRGENLVTTTGARKGSSAPLMQAVVANLTGDDLVAIAAYVTSTRLSQGFTRR